MKLWSLAALALASCSASPPPPAPPSQATPAAAPSLATPWVELTGTVKETRLVGHDAGGHPSYDVRLSGVEQVILAPDGGVFVAMEGAGDAGALTTALLRLDRKGETAWRLELPGYPSGVRLAASRGRLLAYQHAGNRLFVIDADRGVSLYDRELFTPRIEASDEVVVLAEPEGVTRLSFDGEPLWKAHIQPFPAILPTAVAADDNGQRYPELAVGSDGTVLTGGHDGALVAIDRDGNGLYQLGVRGRVTRIEARARGVFAVFAEIDPLTLVGPGGVVLPESADDASRAASGPPGVLDARSDVPRAAAQPKPAAASSLRATAAYRVRPDGPGGVPFHRVISMAVLAPGDVWALGQATVVPGDADSRLYHHDGHAWSDEGKPKVRFAKEVFAEGKPAAVGTFEPSLLARSPRGTLLVIGARTADRVRRISVLERSGSDLRERRELRTLLARMEPPWDAPPSYTASPDGREVLCTGAPDACIEVRPGAAPRVLPAGEGRTVPPAPEHPLEKLASVWSSGPDDLWVTGTDHGGGSRLAHYDGRRWWRVLGAEPFRPASIVGVGRGDVWVFGSSGLWHVTPDPSPRPDVEGTAAPPPPAAPPSLPLAVAGVDPSYRLERVALEVDGGRPMRAAIGIVEGPGGVVWMHDGARVVEVDGGRARVLVEAPKAVPLACAWVFEPDCDACTECTDRRPEEVPCQRCLAPLGTGEGVAITEHGWLRLHGGHVGPETTPFFSTVATAASPAGTIWSVSGDDTDAPMVMLHGPQGAGLVTGLPPAVYADVAARADDDVWMAGALTPLANNQPGPSGEGTLVRFDGRVFTRHRGPDGALLAVAALAPGEALAVGVGGGILHVKGSVRTAWHLADDAGRRRPTILRSVAADGAGGAWIVGDGPTLLHWDGATLRRVDASAAGRDAALSAVVAPAAKPGWVGGPGGIFRLVRAR